MGEYLELKIKAGILYRLKLFLGFWPHNEKTKKVDKIISNMKIIFDNYIDNTFRYNPLIIEKIKKYNNENDIDTVDTDITSDYDTNSDYNDDDSKYDYNNNNNKPNNNIEINLNNIRNSNYNNSNSNNNNNVNPYLAANADDAKSGDNYGGTSINDDQLNAQYIEKDDEIIQYGIFVYCAAKCKKRMVLARHTDNQIYKSTKMITTFQSKIFSVCTNNGSFQVKPYIENGDCLSFLDTQYYKQNKHYVSIRDRKKKLAYSNKTYQVIRNTNNDAEICKDVNDVNDVNKNGSDFSDNDSDINISDAKNQENIYDVEYDLHFTGTIFKRIMNTKVMEICNNINVNDTIIVELYNEIVNTFNEFDKRIIIDCVISILNSESTIDEIDTINDYIPKKYQSKRNNKMKNKKYKNTKKKNAKKKQIKKKNTTKKSKKKKKILNKNKNKYAGNKRKQID